MSDAQPQVRDDAAEVEALYHEMVEEYLRHNPGSSISRIEDAYKLALSAHKGQQRDTGEPYITHPLSVALLCAGLSMDEDSIVTALLHDTVEDTPVRLKKIERLFGEDVMKRVDALTKIRRIDLFARFSGRTMSDEQARNLQKLFAAMAQDFTVLVIKLADRLHNLRTLHQLSEERAKRNAKETLDFYTPLARRLGLHKMAHEMEHICFSLLYPKECEWVTRELEKAVGRKSALYDQMSANIKQALEVEGIAVSAIFGRAKSPYSTWRKMRDQTLPLDQLFDLIAVRVVLAGDELDCYRAMGVIHGLYRPLFNRFRDFIAAPKSNGYQSLHTTVAGEGGQITEVQIRTHWMDEVAEHGVAAHWKYKEHSHYRLRETFSWFQFIEDLSEQQLDSRDFIEKTRESLTQGEVLVLSPRGEVVSLPEGSTPLDFAYYIHTDLGHSTEHAIVNGIDMPLDYRLQNGDVVEIVKNKDGTANPKPEWLNIVYSPKSILKIKRWFKGRSRNERIEMGRFLLREQIAKGGLYPLNLMDNTKLMQPIRTLRLRKIDDLFEQIATGNLMSGEVVQKLKQLHIERALKGPLTGGGDAEGREFKFIGISSELGIVRKGGRALRRKVELMSCCTPVPGDEIFGMDNRKEHRVEIHHALCPVAAGQTEMAVIPVEWAEEAYTKLYPARIRVVALNRVGMLFDVLRELSELSINLTSGSIGLQPSLTHGYENAVIEISVEVHDAPQAEDVLQTVRSLEDVFMAQRIHEKLEGA
jgi:guanosine-3',5'-bis(diphosphate) 3'-pyrophosphohydrolase